MLSGVAMAVTVSAQAATAIGAGCGVLDGWAAGVVWEMGIVVAVGGDDGCEESVAEADCWGVG